MQSAAARAPAVHCLFGPTRRLQLLVFALPSLAGCGLFFWCASEGVVAEGRALAAMALYLGLIFQLWRWWQRLPGGILSWDGGQWLLTHSGGQARVIEAPQWRGEVFGGLLLCARYGHGRCHWLWFERGRGDTAAWDGLRRALVATTTTTVSTQWGGQA